MDDTIRRAAIGLAIASTLLLTFSPSVRHMASRTAMRGAARAMDMADDTRDFIGHASDRMR